ncbi:MAG: amidase [Alphaproteobacteria bacterium]|jgi:amidase/6-aminohexanoate-cyclic-dimer hydrolase|nr:amidase [Alphaproteobacteria bacterium]
MDDYGDYDALGLADLVRRKEVTPQDLLDAALARAETAQSQLNCFSALFPEIARKQIEDGLPEGAFKGVPFATKDLGVEIQGAPLTGGSRAFRGEVAARDSVVTQRYRAAGFTLFGQTTSPEYGLTTSTESALYGQTRNPWNPQHTSGGSSGGASAAVASGVLPMAQASDGGGSIRIPAACTGLFGMKPSRGRIPMGPGKTENWNGLSTVHAVSRSVRDNAALMDVTHGPEPGARYGAPPPDRSFLEEVSRPPETLRIALWTTAPNGTTPDPQAHKGLYDTVGLLQELGHQVEEAAPKLDGDALGKGMLMIVSAHSAAMADTRGHEIGRELGPDDLEPVTLRFVELGRTVPMAELVRADHAFIEAALAYHHWMDEGRYDAVLMPTLSREPEPLGRLSLDPEDFDAYGEAVSSFAPWCPVFNQMGAPAMSVPMHWSANGLPIGMMFGARYGQEGLLYRLAGQLEQARPWWHNRPGIWMQ